MNFVVVGNGVAGIEAALALRAREAGAAITIVSEESTHFFSRTALMYVLAGQLRARDLEPYERDLYERQRFSRVRARAVGLDTAGRRLLLGGGLPALPYDRLLLACGSRPRRAPWPGADLAGVGHFVTVQDLAWLEQELHGGPGRGGTPPEPDAHLPTTTADSPYRPRAVAARLRGHTARTAAVIGGGLIGMEVVETLLAAGLRPHLLVREEWCWPMAIDQDEAGWIAQRLREHGVTVHLGREVAAFEGQQGLLSGLRTADGELLPVDLAVVAIGVEPNTGWLHDSGLPLDGRSGGVRVGPDLATGVAGVWAAGDCAAVAGRDGVPRPEQLWYTARDQGRLAARAMLGDAVRYDRGTPYNSAKLMDIEYTTVGRVDDGQSALWSFTLVEEGRVRSSTRLVCEGPRVVGFNLLGRRWDHTLLRRWVEERRDLPWVLERLPRARFDTELVPPLVVPPARLAEARAAAARFPAPNP